MTHLIGTEPIPNRYAGQRAPERKQSSHRCPSCRSEGQKTGAENTSPGALQAFGFQWVTCVIARGGRHVHAQTDPCNKADTHNEHCPETWARFAQADAAALPLATGSVDVIFANLLLPWVSDLDRVFAEVARVLRKEGVFAFATLGPDSLQEIRRAWQQVDADAHVTPFPDMHNLGDGLVQAGLRDPVLDVDRLSVSYRDSRSLLVDLTAAGARNALLERRKTLTGRGRFARMRAALDAAGDSGSLVLDLELVFGHCWGAGPKNDLANFRIDASHIPVRRK